MKKNFAFHLSVLAVFVISGMTNCAQNNKANSPAMTYKQFHDAVQKEDIAAARSAFSKKSLELLNQYFEKQKSSPDEGLKQVLKIFKTQSAPTPEVRNEKIEGDKATLEVKNAGEKWSTYLFVKEEDGWKLELDWLEKMLKD